MRHADARRLKPGVYYEKPAKARLAARSRVDSTGGCVAFFISQWVFHRRWLQDGAGRQSRTIAGRRVRAVANHINGKA